jgi:transposase-like protein
MSIMHVSRIGGLLLVKCPRCGTDISKVTREWNYSAFHVKRYDCQKCEKSFKAYFREGKLSHTIPK